MLSKLSIIKGGLESRFIPTFGDETKSLIEGFFKITQDQQLREYALKRPEDVEVTEEDKLLSEVLEKEKKEKKEDTDDLTELFGGQTDLTLDVLQ